MADKVIALSGNEGMRREYGLESRRMAVDELDIQRCADLHYQAYCQLLAGVTA